MSIRNRARKCADRYTGYFAAVLLLAVGMLPSSFAQAGPRDNTFYWASTAEFRTINPYFDTRPESLVFSRLIWDRLYFREPNAATFKPHLATKLKWIGSRTIELDLRQDVIFHNGDAFSADDVIETVRRMKDSRLGNPNHRGISWIDKIEKLSRFRIRIDLAEPTPNVLEYLSGPFVIVPQAAWRNAPLDTRGRANYRDLAPVGSGPYRVSRILPDRRVELERFRFYHDGPKGRPSIPRITYSTLHDSHERLEQLLDGRLDMIWRLSKRAIDRLQSEGAPLRLVRAPSLRIAFLVLDRAGRNGKNSPFRDVRVRRAIAHAINREEVVRIIFGPTSKVLHALCHPAQTGCIQDVRRYDYDPEQSKKLILEAGYGPAGKYRIVDFLNIIGDKLPGLAPEQEKKRLKSIIADIAGYRNHSASEAMTLYLRAVGIDSTVSEYGSYGTFDEPFRGGRMSLAHMTWASHGFFDLADVLYPLFRNGALDYCRDKEVNQWINVARNSNDGKDRARAHANILRRLQELVCVLPLFTYTTNYAHNRQLDFTPTLDDIPRFYRLKWK